MQNNRQAAAKHTPAMRLMIHIHPAMLLYEDLQTIATAALG
jgi:hypothetical protein